MVRVLDAFHSLMKIVAGDDEMSLVERSVGKLKIRLNESCPGGKFIKTFVRVDHVIVEVIQNLRRAVNQSR